VRNRQSNPNGGAGDPNVPEKDAGCECRLELDGTPPGKLNGSTASGDGN
jgi:hypothetical protein